MGRPSSLSQEQLDEMIKLSETETVSELSRIFDLDRTTIYHHLKQKPRKQELIYKPRPPRKPKIHLIREEKINAGKNYVDYLKIENEERKNKGLYLFKQGK